MLRKILPLLCVLLVAIVSGCSSVDPGKHYGNTPLDSMKTAFIVIKPDYDPHIGANIQEALAQRGVAALAGTFAEKPRDVAFYVEYEDHWRWDLAMYLFSLDVRFIDNTTGTLIGTGAFRQGAFHSFPNPKEKTFEVVDSIYKAR